MDEEGLPDCTRGYREISYFPSENRLQSKLVEGVRVFYTKRVYIPSHDSQILLDTVKTVIAVYSNKVRTVLELGSGSGYVSAQLVLLGAVLYSIMVDIDADAVYSSWATAKENSIDQRVDVVQCDGASCIRSNAVDLVYFNPPYLPVCDDMPGAIAWNGGGDGLEVWTKFFEESLRVCREICAIVFVLSSLQNVRKMLEHLSRCRSVELLNCEAFFYEMLCGVFTQCR